MMMKFGGSFNTAFIEALAPALAQYEAALSVRPIFKRSIARRDSTRSASEIARLNEKRKENL
jgi:hypothetical protein